MRCKDDRINLGPFLKELESRLDRLSPEQIKRCILRRAQDISPTKRRNFLSVYAIPSSDPNQGDTNQQQAEDPELMENITQFVSDLENGAYYHGWGWDDELYEKRAFGDESWAWEMDDLFQRCSKIFLGGNYQLAVKSYGKLLRAFQLQEEVGHFCGPTYPESMIDTDVEEAKARYLRAVYKTTPQEERPARLLSEFEDLFYIGNSKMGLKTIREAESDKLPDFENFLPRWTELLEQKPQGDGIGPQRLHEHLLREATELTAGTEGLGELARRRGHVQPAAYHQWVLRLVQDDSIDEAINAAREGVESIQEDTEKAKLADYLAQLAEDTDEMELALTSRRKAFRFYPSVRRLVACWSTCRKAGKALDACMNRLRDQLSSRRDHPYHRLSAMLELACGKYASAVRRSSEAAPLGWSQTGHPGHVVFPFLLLAATDRQKAPEKSCMEQIVDALDTRSSHIGPHYPYPDVRDPLSDASFRDVLVDALSRHPVPEAERDEYANTAGSVAWKRMEAIVSNKHRKAYERAARIVLATGEAISLRDESKSGLELAREAREKFPRHSAFRRELNELVSYSAILPDVEL